MKVQTYTSKNIGGTTTVVVNDSETKAKLITIWDAYGNQPKIETHTPLTLVQLQRINNRVCAELYNPSYRAVVVIRGAVNQMVYRKTFTGAKEAGLAKLKPIWSCYPEKVIVQIRVGDNWEDIETIPYTQPKEKVAE